MNILFQKSLLAMRFESIYESHNLQSFKSLEPKAKVSSDVSSIISQFNLIISLICLYVVLR